jgi:AraC-like DNA-binding protein
MLTYDALIRLCRARDRLLEMGHANRAISEIAREAAFSTWHFIRQFKAVFGETPHQFRIRSRLEKARQMLVIEGASVTDVCMAVGFSSLGSFSDLFTRRFGEAPTAYRRRLVSAIQMRGDLRAQLMPGCIPLMQAAWRMQT